MLVKCQSCGLKTDRDIAFKIKVQGINKYYCTENEYLKIINEKKIKDDTYITIYEIFGYKIMHTTLFKEVSELATVYTFDKINKYLSLNKAYITSTMQKDFKNEYAKIRYFMAIIRNNLKDFTDGDKEIVIKTKEIDIAKDNYKPRKKRKSLNEFEEEVGY